METNFEHFKDELIKEMLRAGSKCSVRRKYVLGYNCAENTSLTCSKCHEMAEEWLNALYIEPKIEIDWSKVPVDTPVYVHCQKEDTILTKAHFSHYDNEKYYCFINGASSWTTGHTYGWPHCKLACPEDIEKYRKN